LPPPPHGTRACLSARHRAECGLFQAQ